MNIRLQISQDGLDVPVASWLGRFVDSFDEPAKDVMLANAIDVILGVGRSRNEAPKLKQKLRSTDLLYLTTFFKFLFQPSQFDFATPVPFELRFVNGPMDRIVEVARLQTLGAKLTHFFWC